MKKLGIACFTGRGRELAERISSALGGEYEILSYEKGLKKWCEHCFAQAEALIFIGACGIAVRTIAPFLKSKTEDPAVLVMDEAGQYVISLLSGHIGGANELALQVAEITGAAPVITTASDVNGKIAVDVFAKKNHLVIGSMADAKRIAALILKGARVGFCCTGDIQGEIPSELIPVLAKEQKAVSGERSQSTEKLDGLIWVSEYLPEKTFLKSILRDTDGPVLHLIPRNLVLGIGCRRGRAAEAIRLATAQVLEGLGVSARAVKMAASIDLKKEEQGIRQVCRELEIPFVTFSAEELRGVPGVFQASEFVKKTTGVDNVCERSALLAGGKGSRLIQGKYAEDGVTVAVAAQEWRVCFEK